MTSIANAVNSLWVWFYCYCLYHNSNYVLLFFKYEFMQIQIMIFYLFYLFNCFLILSRTSHVHERHDIVLRFEQ